MVVNPVEAEQVRSIYDLYLGTGSLLPTLQEVERRGWTTKRWITKKGTERGGTAFTKNTLHRMLANATYTGRVAFEGQLLEGDHEGIVDEDDWARVQKLLKLNGRTSGSSVRNRNHALLKGLLWCGSCNCRMTPGYTTKGQKRYPYYICLRARQRGWTSCPTKSIAAGEIEAFVLDKIKCIGSDPGLQKQVVTQVRAAARAERRKRKVTDGSYRQSIPTDAEILRALEQFDSIWEGCTLKEQTRIAQLLVERIVYDGEQGEIVVRFRSSGILSLTEESRP